MNEKIIIDYIEMLAERTANIVLKKLAETAGNSSSGRTNDNEEWVDTKSAAQILGVTPNYMRAIKDKFNWKKVGGSERGRVLFNRQELTNYYLNK
jgi:hypothetical protein